MGHIPSYETNLHVHLAHVAFLVHSANLIMQKNKKKRMSFSVCDIDYIVLLLPSWWRSTARYISRYWQHAHSWFARQIVCSIGRSKVLVLPLSVTGLLRTSRITRAQFSISRPAGTTHAMASHRALVVPLLVFCLLFRASHADRRRYLSVSMDELLSSKAHVDCPPLKKSGTDQNPAIIFLSSF